MLRFVVLQHESPRGRHWDFMLETGEALSTWALAEAPDTPSPIDAESLADHRLDYLDYEGPVSAGRGEVTRWDAGTYRFVRQTDRELEIAVEGERLRGTATLARMGDNVRRWRFSMSATESAR